MKPKTQRMWLIIFSLISVSLALWLVLSNLEKQLLFFYSPSDVAQEKPSKPIRVGGLVKQDSVIPGEDPLDVTFTITDHAHEIVIHHHGLVPTLFREGQGIIARGVFKADGEFYADELLAKHDENYMPPEVAKSLKEQHDAR